MIYTVPVVYNFENPTKTLLIKTAVELIRKGSLESISSEQILRESGLSKGSLYHHFADFAELLEEAQVVIFGEDSLTMVATLHEYLVRETNGYRARERVRMMAVEQQFNLGKAAYRIHLAVTYLASARPRMQARLAESQELQTKLWSEIYEACIKQGWCSYAMDSRSVSIIVQSILLGQILDHNAPIHTSNESRIKAIDVVFDNLLFNKLMNHEPAQGASAQLDPADLPVQMDYRLREVESSTGDQLLERRTSFLKIGHTTDLSVITAAYLDSTFKDYCFDIIGPQFARSVLDLFISSCDLPNFKDALQPPPNMESILNFWGQNQMVYGAFHGTELVGFIRTTDINGVREIDRCIVSRDFRNKGLSTSLTAFTVLSGKSLGIYHFISQDDHLFPHRTKVMQGLGFAEGTGLPADLAGVDAK